MSLSFSLIMASVLTPPALEPPPHFETEIIPVLTKAGCNAGSCHGAAAGRGGFHLSLWGSDTSADYQAIVQEFEGRRINLSHPQRSLILRKPTGEIDHEGGVPLLDHPASAKRIQDWIAAGAPRGEHRKLRQFLVTPKTQVVQLDQAIPLRAQAAFAEGALTDVTEWTVWKPADPASVKIDWKTTTAKIQRPGQHIIIARFLDQVVPIQLLVPFSTDAVDLSQEPSANPIDDFVLKKLSDLHLPVSPVADSATFIRRVTLDLTGRLPDPKIASRFILTEAQSPDKMAVHRRVLVDELLKSEAFVEYWSFRLAELLRVGGGNAGGRNTGGMERAKVFHAWIEGQLRKQTSLDQIARDLITANGDPLKHGPANFYLVAGNAREQAEYISQTFMGVRLRCANCHNHPLDRWTQDDYHGFAAVFARIDRGPVIRQKSFGNVIHPKTGEPAIPRIPGDRDLTPNIDQREPIANWLTDSQNPYFSRAMVNRLWQSLMGRGLVNPTDDLSQTNPATHPELLTWLAKDFVKHHYDIRHALRQIALSRTYQRSSTPVGINAQDKHFYSRQQTRKLAAEVLVDAWSDVTGVSEHYPNASPGTRAIALVSPGVESRALDVLGRCGRDGECESAEGTTVTASLAAKLHLLNGKIINAKIASPKGRLHLSIQAKQSNTQILDEFYLCALSRPPTGKEKTYWLAQFAATPKTEPRQNVLEDFLWSLLTCQEFSTNH